GWDTGQMLDGIGGILNLAAASGEDLATTSDIVTDAMTAFNKKAEEAGHFADVLAAAAANANTTVSGMGETFKYAGSMAGALGYSVEDVALMTGLIANTGIKGTMAGTALNSIFTRLATDAGASSKSLGALGTLTKELGVEFYTSEGNARALSDVITELRAATAGMNNEEKTNIANKIAGMEAQKGLLAILNASEDDYRKLAEAIENADGSAQAMSETMLDNLSGSITLLQSAVDGVKLSFGERLSPYVRSLADWLTDQMPAIEQGLNEFMDWVDTRVDRMQRKFHAIADTKEWQDADFFGKVGIAWDEFIAEPFSEWWNSRGKAKLAGFAQDIGSGIGTGLKVGIMTLLGIDLGETLDEGVSIGVSFAKGFSEGFDFDAVSKKLRQGFGNLLSSAGKLLPGGETPDLSSWVSAFMLRKLTKPFVGLGKGIFNVGKIGKILFASGEGNLGLGRGIKNGISKLLGDFSIADEIAGTGMAGGKGLFGLFGKAGIALGSHSLSSTGLVAAGGTATIGGAAAGATLISSALDAYRAMKSENKEESKAYGESAAWKAGGVAAGAAAGAALGSVIPGIGTAIGALTGAGVGGIVGWIKGNRIKEEYQQNVAQMQKEAEKAQKVFEATGLSIEEITFKNEALVQAMNDSEVSASQFALMFQEECANVAKKAFGDISLSLAEVKKVAGEITFAGMEEELNEFAKVTADTEAALSSLKSSVSSLKKENWKVGLGMELSETEKDGYKSAIERFLNTSKAFIDDNHYQATVALQLLAGGEADTAGLDRYYGGLESQIEDLSTRLAEAMNIALEDSVITLDEAAELESLQNQISEITNKLTEATTDAEMQTLQIKYNGAAVDLDSFNALQEELQANVASASEQYERALTLTLTNLNLQQSDAEFKYNNGLISEGEYKQIQEEIQRQKDEASELYYTRINELSARPRTFSLESIAAAWDSKLSNIMPGIEGTTAEKLTQALNRALLVNPDPKNWTQEDVRKWFGLERLAASNGEAFETIYQELIQTALAVPKGTKEQLVQNFRDSLPTVDEILEYLDWGNYSTAAFDQLTEHMIDSGAALASDADWVMYKGWSPEDSILKGVSGRNLDTAKQHIAEDIREALETTPNMAVALEFMTYMKNSGSGNIMAQYGPISNEYYEQLMSEWMAAGTACGNALNNGASTSLLSGSALLRADLQTALNAAVANPFIISPMVNVTPNYSMIAQRFPATGQGVSGHAAGGFVSGGPQLSWLAEEGYGEFVIPTNPSRRARALELYEQAGAALGVSAYVDGETAQTYEPASAGMTGGAGSIPIQVNVSVPAEFVIHGGEGQNEEDIVKVIKRHIREMADELGLEVAGKLEEVFSNMPLKEA
ncbi:MAG: phage tail tape measure protein, partial [Lachnospiraceae bacterium]|nr:phage tail tape measure protein [Lachnospiraceae bacterium]